MAKRKSVPTLVVETIQTVEDALREHGIEIKKIPDTEVVGDPYEIEEETGKPMKGVTVWLSLKVSKFYPDEK